MSLPPETIRVKRKREDEETPVTFLLLEESDGKRRRGDKEWMYQRRSSVRKMEAPLTRSLEELKPMIRVSQPGEEEKKKRRKNHTVAETSSRTVTGAAGQISKPKNSTAKGRRFHIARSLRPSQAESSSVQAKRARQMDAVFVESSKRRMTEELASQQIVSPLPLADDRTRLQQPVAKETPESKTLKKPSSMSRLGARYDTSSAVPNRIRTPVPAVSQQPSSMDKIASEMNEWVLREIGANLESLDKEKRRELEIEKARLRPKVPNASVRTLADLRRELSVPVPSSQSGYLKMDEDEDEDEGEGGGEDWIIEEYVRIPAYTITSAGPGDVGVLVLDGEGDDVLFYGPEKDDQDEWPEDDEDENAEDHYTADYPEDEVDTDDEFGQRAYQYRNGFGSDDEEFDGGNLSDGSDDMILEGGDDDDTVAARIKKYMSRSHAFNELPRNPKSS